MGSLRTFIGGAFGRLALVGLWLLVAPQLVVPGWAWDADSGQGPSPLQSHEPLPGEAGEAEELKELGEDSDDRLALQAELAAADHAGLFPDCSARFAFVPAGPVHPSLLDRLLFRPPTTR